MEPVDKKFEAFGWNAIMVDGHNFPDLKDAFNSARNELKKPTVLIAKTLVGKGCLSLEGQLSHNMILPENIAVRALEELEEVI